MKAIKSIKKIISIALVIAMLVSFSAVAYGASEFPSAITLRNPATGQMVTFTIDQLTSDNALFLMFIEWLTAAQQENGAIYVETGSGKYIEYSQASGGAPLSEQINDDSNWLDDTAAGDIQDNALLANRVEDGKLIAVVTDENGRPTEEEKVFEDTNSLPEDHETPELDEELLAELQDAKDAADALIEEDYDAELWAEFTAALTAALDLPETTNDELTAKIAAINEAIEILDDEGGGEEAVSITSIKVLTTTMIEVTLSGAPAEPPTAADFAAAEFAGSQTNANNAATTKTVGYAHYGNAAVDGTSTLTVTLKNGTDNVYVLTWSNVFTTNNYVAVAGRSDAITGLAGARFIASTTALLTENSVGDEANNAVDGLDSALYYTVKVMSGKDTGYYLEANDGADITLFLETPQYITAQATGDIVLVDGITYEVLESDATEPLFTEGSLVIAELDNTASYNVIVADGLGLENGYFVKSDSTTQAGAATVNGAQAKALTLVNGAQYTITKSNGASFSLAHSATPSTTPAVAEGYYKLTLGGTPAAGYFDAITDIVIRETVSGAPAVQQIIPVGSLTPNTAKTELYIPISVIDNIFPGDDANQTVTINAENFAPITLATGAGITSANVIDTVAPVLSQVGNAIRTADNAATINLKSIEAGTAGSTNVTLYYKAGASAAAVVDATNKTGTEPVAKNDTAHALTATLVAGPQVVSIVLVDARGNVSNRLDIPIPAFVEGLSTGPYKKVEYLSAADDVAIVDGKLMWADTATTETEILPGSQNYDGIISLLDKLSYGDKFELTSIGSGSLINGISNASGKPLTLQNLDIATIDSTLTLTATATGITINGNLTGKDITLVGASGGGKFNLSGLTAHGALLYNTAQPVGITLSPVATGARKLTVGGGVNSNAVSINAATPGTQIEITHDDEDAVSINNIIVDPTTSNRIVTVTSAGLDIEASGDAIVIDASAVKKDVTVRFVTADATPQGGAIELTSTNNLAGAANYTLTLVATTASSNGAITLKNGRFDLSSTNLTGNLIVASTSTATLVSGSTFGGAASSRNVEIDGTSGKLVIENGASFDMKAMSGLNTNSTGVIEIEAGATVLSADLQASPITLFGPSNSVYTINSGKVKYTLASGVHTYELGEGSKLTVNRDRGLGSARETSTGEIIKLNHATAELVVASGATLHINGKVSKIDVVEGTFTISGIVRLNNEAGSNGDPKIALADDLDAKMVISSGGWLGVNTTWSDSNDSYLSHNEIEIGAKAVVEGFGTEDIVNDTWIASDSNKQEHLYNYSNTFYDDSNSMLTSNSEIATEGTFKFSFDADGDSGDVVGWIGTT